MARWAHGDSYRSGSACISGAVLEVGGGKRQGLLNILWLQLGVVPENVRTIRIHGYGLNHSTHSQPHTTDTGLSVHLLGIPGNPIEALHQVLFSYISVTDAGFVIHALGKRPSYSEK